MEKYSEPELAVLKKYRIVLPAGEKIRRGGQPHTLAQDEIRTCNLKLPLEKPLGEGPIVNPDVIRRLLDADQTPDKRWLDWIFYQAGGGDRAVQMRDAALHQVREKFIGERVNGFPHPETGQFIPPVSAAEAETRWQQALPRFQRILSVCDQDQVEKLKTFGYYRTYPGRERIYENVISAVVRFQKFFKKLIQMNKERARDGHESLATTPEEIKTYEEMNRISDKVERYFASKVAREDIRLSSHPKRDDGLIYDDDVITVMAPLTWAAAVRYGYPSWAWANRETFDSVLSGEGNDYNNQWKSRTGKGNVYVYITFNSPVPVWISRAAGTFKHFQLTNLALELDATNLPMLGSVGSMDSLLVWDEENRNSLTIADVKQMILDEPTRQDPQDEEIPLKRGKNVYSTPEEAQNVVNHLDAALKAIQEWAETFDRNTIKKDAMKLD